MTETDREQDAAAPTSTETPFAAASTPTATHTEPPVMPQHHQERQAPASSTTAQADTSSQPPSSGASRARVALRRAASAVSDRVGFLHHMDSGEFDSATHAFEEPPAVRVLGGRVKEGWPSRYVEYDVELRYRGFTWTVEIPKSAISSLWLYIKSRPHLRHPAIAVRADSGAGGILDSAHAGVSSAFFAAANAFTDVNNPSAQVASRDSEESEQPARLKWPQMRRLLLANAEKSVSEEMVALVQKMLEIAVQVERLRSSAALSALFQVSNSTFDEEDGRTSLREGWLKVRFWLKGHREDVRINRAAVSCDNECVNCMCIVKRVNFRSKRTRWVALKHSSIAIYDSIESVKPLKALLFDSKFAIDRGLEATGSNTTLLISNATYVLQLEAKTKQVIHKWANAIRQASEASLWAQVHRDGSFAIPRSPMESPTYAKWFVDGEGAYAAMYNAILGAKKQIFIAGWWVCPTIHLLRPAEEHPDSRLDLLLQAKAKEGVDVYVLMYKEVAMALTLNSMYSKQVLNDLHKNVHVLRDPDFIVKQFGLWSHHEKIVCVDQTVSFVGGLDLCFGRWDTHSHELYDAPDKPTDFVGKDYSNPRVKDFIEVDQPEVDMIDRTKVPRMPWHDCHCRLEGQPARDVARHFVQRWNYSVSTRKKSKKLRHLIPRKDFSAIERSAVPLRRRFQTAVHAVRAMHNIRQLTQQAQQQEDTSKRGFNRHRGLAEMLHLARPASSESDSSQENAPPPMDPEVEALQRRQHETKGFMCHAQIVRSLSQWSGGTATERSIQNAYLRLIGNAQHFVYIENQFFVSGLDGDPMCSNRIANALVERIRRAADNKEKFRVMVVMPLLPAFPGKPGEKDSSSLCGVMHWQYRSISRGKHSIYHALLKDLDVDPFKYIAFYGLRNHATPAHGSGPQAEEVYIHSKIMIVDDRTAIIGSANINERSMCGDRDSEIAVVLEDHEMEPANIKIANGGFAVGKFAHSFRMKLFEEHFGATPGSELYKRLQDPVNTDAWFSMQEHAMRNHLIYEGALGCWPTDSVTKYSQLNGLAERAASQRSPASVTPTRAPINGAATEPAHEPDSEPVVRPKRKSVFGGGGDSSLNEVVDAELDKVQGHIVYFPLNFLADEQLAPAVIPANVFQ